MDRLLAEVSIDSRRPELSSGRAATVADPHSVICAALAVRMPLSLVRIDMRIGSSPLLMIICPDRC
jgi:hypothetical protein